MMGRGYKLTIKARRAIVRDAVESELPYKEIAAKWNVSRPRVSQLALAAGHTRQYVPLRREKNIEATPVRPTSVAAPEVWVCPPELKEMFDSLRVKVGQSEARRMIKDHIEKKGLKR